MKQRLIKFKENKLQLQLEVSIPFSQYLIQQVNRKSEKITVDLNNTINQFAPINIYRICCQITDEYTIFPSAHKTCIKTDYARTIKQRDSAKAELPEKCIPLTT